MAILANPVAGKGPSRGLVEELVAALQRRGFQTNLCWERERLAVLAAERGSELRCVVAAGGDGTLAEVLNRVPGVPVALLPLGNENLVAQHFNYPRSGERVAEIIARGQYVTLDLATANGRKFSLMAGAGFDADVVHRVHQHRSGHINRLSYLPPIWNALQGYSFPPIEVEIEETGARLRGAFAFVFNLPCYGMKLPIAPGARADDGLLDLWVFQRPGLWNLTRYFGVVVLGKRKHHRDIQHRRVRRVQLSSPRPVPLQTDGDSAGMLPATIEVIPGALRLLAPVSL